MGIKTQLFGGFSIQVNDVEISGLNSRHQVLLAYLAIQHPKPVPRSELAFKFWLDSNEEQALTNLRKALHQIKQNLSDRDFIQANSRTLQLNLDIRLDIADFTSALNSAERARHANDVETEQTSLETASAFYRGDLLPNLYDEWIVPERERLRGLFMQSIDRLIALLEARKHYRDAIKHAQRLLQTDNLREETYRTLIRLHALNADRAAALNVYHACASALSTELGVEPDASTRELYERLLKNDSYVLQVNTPVLPISHPLVARENEWMMLLREWKQASSGNLRMTLLSGEAGIGKTRLAEELLHWAGRQGIRTLTAACYSAEGQASFAPVVDWLRSLALRGLDTHWRNELSRVLPELRSQDMAPQPMIEKWQRQVFFESMARAMLAENEPLVLLLDDIQWCDNDTLDWLRYFLHFDKTAKILLLVTLRAEELPSNNALQLLLVDLRTTGQLTEMELSRLDEKQTAELGTHLLGKKFSNADSSSLFRASEGVPLFVVELANTGFRGEAVYRTEAGTEAKDAKGLPPRLKAILEGRLTRLSAPARAVIESAAVIGREFDINLLRQVSEIDESSTVTALDELWRVRMVRERSGHYDFSHDKLREVTLAGISPIRLRWLHQRAAEALEAEDSGEAYARIAGHFERAGLSNKASLYYTRAAKLARQLFAFTEALEYLRNAILLETRHADLANLHEECGDVLKMLDKRDAAYQAFSQAHGLSNDALQRARLNRNQFTLVSRFETETAREKYHTALEELSRAQADPGYWSEWIEVQLSWIEACYWIQDAKAIDELMARVKQPVEQHGTTLQKIKYRFRLISSALINERYLLDQSHVSLAKETMSFASEFGDPYQISNAKRQLGMVAMFARQFDIAETTFRETISLCEKNNDMNSMLIARVYLSFTHRCQRKPQEVRTDTDLLEQLLGRVSEHPTYRGVVYANRAWLAWLDNDHLQTKQLARSAMETWQSQKNPHMAFWLALTPLLALAISEKKTDEALAYSQALLTPLQMRLHSEFESVLLSALEVDPVDKKLSLHRFRDVLEKAKETGYL